MMKACSYSHSERNGERNAGSERHCAEVELTQLLLMSYYNVLFVIQMEMDRTVKRFLKEISEINFT